MGRVRPRCAQGERRCSIALIGVRDAAVQKAVGFGSFDRLQGLKSVDRLDASPCQESRDLRISWMLRLEMDPPR
jgi:hypothetical protein